MSQPTLQRLIDGAHAAALGLSMLLLAAMVGMVTLNVVTRYLLQISLTWSAELARYCLVWSALLAAAVLVGRGEHMAVDVLERRLGANLRRRVRVLVSVVSLTFFACLFVSGVMLVVGTVGQVASSIDVLPMSVVYAIIPVSALLMFAGSAAALWHAVKDEDVVS